MVFGTVRYVWFILLHYIFQMLSFHYITRTISHNLAKECYNCHAAQRFPSPSSVSPWISLSLFFCLSLSLFSLYISVYLSSSISSTHQLLLHSLSLCLSIFVSLPFSLVSVSLCLCLFVSICVPLVSISL